MPIKDPEKRKSYHKLYYLKHKKIDNDQPTIRHNFDYLKNLVEDNLRQELEAAKIKITELEARLFKYEADEVYNNKIDECLKTLKALYDKHGEKITVLDKAFETLQGHTITEVEQLNDLAALLDWYEDLIKFIKKNLRNKSKPSS